MRMAEGSDGLEGKTDDKDFGEDVNATAIVVEAEMMVEVTFMLRKH